MTFKCSFGTGIIGRGIQIPVSIWFIKILKWVHKSFYIQNFQNLVRFKSNNSAYIWRFCSRILRARLSMGADLNTTSIIVREYFHLVNFWRIRRRLIHENKFLQQNAELSPETLMVEWFLDPNIITIIIIVNNFWHASACYYLWIMNWVEISPQWHSDQSWPTDTTYNRTNRLFFYA